MRPVLVAILLSVAACMSSCERSSSATPAGSSWHRISNNCSAYCFTWKGNEIPYVLFLRETRVTPEGPVRGGRSSVKGDTVSNSACLRLDGKEFSVGFTSATPDVIRIDGKEYRLSNGRVFVCRMKNETLVVKQVAVPIQPSADSRQEIMRLVQEKPVQQLLSDEAETPMPPKS
ncbi:MAG: hypothetical protein K8S55_00745 [Phycisphaerae bacterium]|nr:hypothetical protein [Phycisphaerae bacterium]